MFSPAKSVLPPDLESKRLQIAKTHNRLVLGLLTGLFASLFLLVAIAITIVPKGGARRQQIFLSGVVAIALLEGYGLFRIIKYDAELSRRLSFMCPHCYQPLYEPRGFINVTGRCPKCKKSVVS